MSFAKRASLPRVAGLPVLLLGPLVCLLTCGQLPFRGTMLPLTLFPLLAVGVTAPSWVKMEGIAAVFDFAPQAVQMDRYALLNLPTTALTCVDGNYHVTMYAIERSPYETSREVALVPVPNKIKRGTIPLVELLSRSGAVLLTLKPVAAPIMILPPQQPGSEA